MRWQIVLISAVTTLLSVSTPSARGGASENPCVAVYEKAAQRVEYESGVDATYAAMVHNACSSSNRSYSLGFDSVTKGVISSVPAVSSIVAKAGYTNNKQLCDAQSTISSNASASERLVIEPFAAAQPNFNECMRIYTRSQVEITHQVGSLGLVTLFIRQNDPNRRLEIQGIATEGGFKCSTVTRGQAVGDGAIGPQTQLVLDHSENIRCTRPAESCTGGDCDYQQGVIQLGTSDGTYTVRIPEDTALSPASKREASEALASANAAIREQAGRLSKLSNAMASARLESRAFYFGQYDEPFTPSHGKRYGCDLWLRISRNDWEEFVPKDLCPGAAKTQITHLFTRSGNHCGYNYYTLACEYRENSGTVTSTDEK